MERLFGESAAPLLQWVHLVLAKKTLLPQLVQGIQTFSTPPGKRDGNTVGPTSITVVATIHPHKTERSSAVTTNPRCHETHAVNPSSSAAGKEVAPAARFAFRRKTAAFIGRS